ncbi:unnamed protein product [Somion occarium]|uniref:Uncharacterized protein n=1 Tax=Somion occarium TaxID=3059160 RepID=A0ABP1CLB9_9APHY
MKKAERVLFCMLVSYRDTLCLMVTLVAVALASTRTLILRVIDAHIQSSLLNIEARFCETFINFGGLSGCGDHDGNGRRWIEEREEMLLQGSEDILFRDGLESLKQFNIEVLRYPLQRLIDE